MTTSLNPVGHPMVCFALKYWWSFRVLTRLSYSSTFEGANSLSYEDPVQSFLVA